jgi:hypothetical protein
MFRTGDTWGWWYDREIRFQVYFGGHLALLHSAPLTSCSCTRRLDGVVHNQHTHVFVINDVGPSSLLLLLRMVIRFSFGTKSFSVDFVIRWMHHPGADIQLLIDLQLPLPMSFYKYLDPDTTSTQIQAHPAPLISNLKSSLVNHI